jgi:hypothetical protein
MGSSLYDPLTEIFIEIHFILSSKTVVVSSICLRDFSFAGLSYPDANKKKTISSHKRHYCSKY